MRTFGFALRKERKRLGRVALNVDADVISIPFSNWSITWSIHTRKIIGVTLYNRSFRFRIASLGMIIFYPMWNERGKLETTHRGSFSFVRSFVPSFRHYLSPFFSFFSPFSVHFSLAFARGGTDRGR